MLKILDEEIKRLEHLMERSIDLTIERTEYKKFVDLAPQLQRFQSVCCATKLI